MQNYLFNFVIQGNFWMICTFLFWQKKTNSFLKLNCRYSKANNFSQVVPWPIKDYRRTYSHFPSGPRHGLWHFYKKLFIIPYQQKTFLLFSGKLYSDDTNLFKFSFINESMFNLFVSIKQNIQKFTLFIEKVTSKKNSIKYEFFSTKFGFIGHLKIKQYA